MSELFHLHFNAPDVDATAGRLEAVVPLRRRFGSVRGNGVSLEPGETPPDDFRFELQVHQRGRVNVTLAPGGRPRFDHLGVVVADLEDAIAAAAARGWSVRDSARRTFAMTPWGFRVELHGPDGAVVRELGSSADGALSGVVLEVPDPDAVRAAFDDVLGALPVLEVARGVEPWVSSFTVDGTRVDTGALLGADADA